MAVSLLQMPAFPHQMANDENDMEAFVDFGEMPAPTPTSTVSQLHQTGSNTNSTLASPLNSALPLDSQDGDQTPMKPTHDYTGFRQQTGLPSNSVPGLQSQSSSMGYQFSNSGLGFEDGSMPSFEGFGSGFSMGGDMDMEFSNGNGNLPAFFFPPGDGAHSNDFVDPSNITQEEERPVRLYPGMHQQQAAMAAKAHAQEQARRQAQQAAIIAQQQKQRAQQQAQSQGHRKASSQITDARTEETISRVVNQIRHNSTLGSSSQSPEGNNLLPHIAKMRKDEEDMDEDERLLASEEGKKLSSKERRQLRNKVSARAFRSRRKEYIGQLEGEVAQKVQEANELRIQNQALMEENARSMAFIKKLIGHPAFHPYLEELSRDPGFTQPSRSSVSHNNIQPGPGKDMNPYGLGQQQVQQQVQQQPQQQHRGSQQQDNLHVGMTMIPETPVDLSMLSINNTWAGMPAIDGFQGYQQPQIYSVTELPEGPIAPFETAFLSGKSAEQGVSPVFSSVKADYPVVESADDEEFTAPSAAAPVESDSDCPLFDDATAAPTSSSPLSFGPLVTEKLAALTTTTSTSSSSSQHSLERRLAQMDAVFERLALQTSFLES